MALVLKDRVKETTSTSGTGTLTLLGAVQGYQAFSSIGNGNTTYYCIQATSDWEVGIGTVGSGTLSRDTVLASSNNGSLVGFGAGVKDVFCTYPASKSVSTDNFAVTGALNTDSPNATVNVASLTSAVATTNGDIAIVPKGTGAKLAQVPTGTTAGGNKRGAYAVDWQTLRALATDVASGDSSTVGGGYSNRASGTNSVVSGGSFNYATALYGTVSGGGDNEATATGATVAGGSGNEATALYAFVGAGRFNVCSGQYAAICTGYENIGSGNYSVLGGGQTNTVSATHGVVGGGLSNTNSGQYATISGGRSNTASGNYSTVGGGINHQATAANATVGGGNQNIASGGTSTISGGQQNTASAVYSVVGGGYINNATAATSTVAGGDTNTASGVNSAVLGGSNNVASGVASSVVGGTNGTTRGIAGMHVASTGDYPVGFTVGSAQAGTLIIGRVTTDAVTNALRSTTAAAGAANQLVLADNSALSVHGTVIARGNSTGDVAGWTFVATAKRGANAASTAIVASSVTSIGADSGASTWVVAIAADTTNGALQVNVTGQAGVTISWVCTIRSAEVIP